MINTSLEYQQALDKDRSFTAKVSCLLKDGTALEFDKTNLMSGGIKISDGVSGTSKFDIGSAIINQLTVMLCNEKDEFSDYDFTNALLTVFIGLQLPDRTEWLKKGVFHAIDPNTTPSVITLQAWDNMSKFDVAYDGNLSFPATLQSIVQYCCSKCGVLLVNGQFPNYAYTVQKNPFDEKSSVTYRALLSYCALLAGCFARCNADGRLELKWYDTTAFDGIIDGGVFDETTAASYQTGDALDGGNFTNYTSGDTADGGSFTDVLPYHHIFALSSLSVSTEDVVITGIRVTAADSVDGSNKLEGETYLCGAEGYILSVSGNPLIECGKARTVAEYLAGRVVGMRFRPFNASCISDPSMEAGDPVILTDRKGNSYSSYLTNLSYSIGSYESISCDAEPAARHSADRYSQMEQIVSDIKKDSQQKLSSYAEYVNQMNQLAINAMGYYETNETQDDGSVINYMHDKPLLSESTIVYKKSIDGFFWSKDGGQTWTGGIDKNGNAVMNVIAAIGISFDWAHGGILTLGGADNVNGVLEVMGADGVEVCRMDNKGAKITGEVTIKSKALHGQSNSNMVAKFGEIDLTSNMRDGFEIYNDAIPEAKIAIIPKVYSDSTTSHIYSPIGMYLKGIDSSVSLREKYISLSTGTNSNQTEGIFMSFHGAGQEVAINTNYKIMSVSSGSSPGGGEVYIQGTLRATGGKTRVVKTKNYKTVTLNAVESPECYFEDYGGGIIGEDGKCYVYFDPVFAETINLQYGYRVSMTRTNPLQVEYSEKKETYFIVYGEPGATFDWNVVAKQRGYERERLETFRLPTDPIQYDDSIFAHKGEMEEMAFKYLRNHEKEIENYD